MKKNRFDAYLMLLVIVLALAAVLRFSNLSTTPGWWPDEGVMLNITNNVAHGKLQMISFSYPLFPHLPLYFLVNAIPVLAFGSKLIVLRTMAAIIGLVAVFFVYKIGKTLKNERVGLIAALLFAIHPLVLINARIGLDYHFLTLLFILTFFFSAKFSENKKPGDLTLMAVFASLAMVTSALGIVAVLYAILFTLFNDWKKIAKVVIILVVPIGIYLLFILKKMPAEFIHDVVYTFFSRPEASENNLASVLGNYKGLFLKDVILSVGIVGLFFIPKKIKWWTLLFFVLITFAEFRSRGDWWYISTYLFLPMIGFAAIAEFVAKLTDHLPGHRTFKNLIYSSVMIIILASSARDALRKDYDTAIMGHWFGLNEEKFFSPESFDNLNKAVSFINENTKTTDMVMASPHLAWLIDTKPTDPILAWVYKDHETFNFASDFHRTGRFVYDSSIESTKFLLEDKFVRNWYINQPGIKEGVLEPIYKNWTIAFQAGEFKVYENPNI